MITGLITGFVVGAVAYGIYRLQIRKPRATSTTTQVCGDCGLSITSPVDYLLCLSCRAPLAAGEA